MVATACRSRGGGRAAVATRGVTYQSVKGEGSASCEMKVEVQEAPAHDVHRVEVPVHARVPRSARIRPARGRVGGGEGLDAAVPAPGLGARGDEARLHNLHPSADGIVAAGTTTAEE